MNEWLAESWVLVAMIFVAGSLAAGFVAARLWPTRPYLAAILVALAVEADLLIILMPGLSVMALLISAATTTLLALLAGWLGRHVRVQA